MTVTLCVFRRDMRLADNPALTAAAQRGPVACAFWVDPPLLDQGAATRFRLQGAATALDADLRNRGGGLSAVHGDAAALAEHAVHVGVDEVHLNDWPAPARNAADAALEKALSARGIRLVRHHAHTLFPPGAVRTATGEVFRVYSAFARAARRLGVPESLPAPASLKLIPPKAAFALNIAADMQRGAAVVAAHSPPPGEAAAVDRLAALHEMLPHYPEHRDRPDLGDGTSRLSDALAVGELSPRSVWAAAERLGQQRGLGRGADKFQSELLWRDFAWSLLTEAPDLDRREWAPRFEGFPWRGASGDLTAWQRGITGEPMVDAGMRELFVTGRMHNRVRMISASYLTKHLLTDWRLGLAWFADTLVDWDPASNAMNWQWVAGSGPDAAPYFRVFNPALQAEKFDPDGTYRRRWLWGWQGSRSAEARAFFDAAPRSWGLDPDAAYPETPIISRVDERKRALDAFASLPPRQD